MNDDYVRSYGNATELTGSTATCLLIKVGIITIIITIIVTTIIITRPKPAYDRHGLAGSSDGDQSGRINSSHSMIHKFKRSDWMGLSGGLGESGLGESERE